MLTCCVSDNLRCGVYWGGGSMLAHSSLQMFPMFSTPGWPALHHARSEALLLPMLRDPVRPALWRVWSTYRCRPGSDESRCDALARNGRVFCVRYVCALVDWSAVSTALRPSVLLAGLLWDSAWRSSSGVPRRLFHGLGVHGLRSH